MSSTAMVAKVQMDSIVNQLGSEYTRDILAWLRSRELTTPGCRQQSPQLASRRHLVEWTTEVAGKLSLSAATLHLALRIVDLFMDGHDIQEPQLYLVCLGALLLASKMEERDGTMPRCSQLNLFVKNYFPLADFLNLEFVMLAYFNWNLALPTMHNTTSLLLPHAVLPTDLHNGGPIVHQGKAAAYLAEYVNFFLSAALSDPAFLDASPSLLGTAIIAASRVAFGLLPTWPLHLQRLSGYGELQLARLATLLLAHHGGVQAQGQGFLGADFLLEDEGYHSLESSPTSSQHGATTSTPSPLH